METAANDTAQPAEIVSTEFMAFEDDFDPAQPAVSWPAVIAGAVVTLAAEFVLIALGAGFGWRLASSWADAPPAGEDVTAMLGVWLVVVQVLAGGLGGYIAGRLRTRWRMIHAHETHFRDTAHGLIAWSLATVAGFVLAG